VFPIPLYSSALISGFDEHDVVPLSVGVGNVDNNKASATPGAAFLRRVHGPPVMRPSTAVSSRATTIQRAVC
jgi:hypothetical protein